MHLVAFLVVAPVVIVTPGPDTALIVRNTLRGGRRGGVLSAAGVVTGQATWTAATAAGVAAALVASEPVFRGVRYAGAAYLVVLGLASIRGRRGVAGTSTGVPFRQGLVSNLTNPKMIAFFPALLPQFARSSVDVLALGLLFAAMTFAWLSAYAVVAARTGELLRRRRVRRLLEAATGSVLVGLGLRLAAER